MKISRKEILDDPKWIKFNPIKSDGWNAFCYMIKHEDMDHLVVPKFYEGRIDVCQVECWTCRVIYFFGPAKDMENIVNREHWLYNDFPDKYQDRIMGNAGK